MREGLERGVGVVGDDVGGFVLLGFFLPDLWEAREGYLFLDCIEAGHGYEMSQKGKILIFLLGKTLGCEHERTGLGYLPRDSCSCRVSGRGDLEVRAINHLHVG